MLFVYQLCLLDDNKGKTAIFTLPDDDTESFGSVNRVAERVGVALQDWLG